MTFLLLSSLSLGIGGAVAYYTAKQALLRQILKHVAIETRSRSATVSAYVDSLKKRTEDFSSDGYIRDAAKTLQTEGSDALRAELNRHLLKNKVSIVPDFFETLVVGRDGTVIASSLPANVGLDLSEQSLFIEGMRATRVFVGKADADGSATSRPSLDISTPLTDRETYTTLGVIINRVRPDSLFRVVSGDYPPQGERAKEPKLGDARASYYLLDHSGHLLLATHVQDTEEVFEKRKIWPPSGGEYDATGTVESAQRTGYLGGDVISAWGDIPGTSWTLVSEVEARAALHPIAGLRETLGLVAAFMAVLTTILLFFPTKFMIGPIQRLRDAARRIEKGDFSIAVEVDSKDEIGQLATAFNRMARGLQERSQLEERLYRQEKMTVIGEISAAVAHEMNTPLASIAMFSQMLTEDTPEDSPFREHAEVILRNSRACEKIVRSLLAYSRRGNVERSRFVLNDAVREAFDLCRPFLEKSGIRYELDLEDALPEHVGDKDALRQVFVNLTMNAIQAMDAGGKLTVRTSGVVVDGCDTLAIEFIDTGKGISTEDQDRIFEPFFTTKPEQVGTGLGLSISRRIVGEEGGRIELTPKPDQGAHFSIHLPVGDHDDG